MSEFADLCVSCSCAVKTFANLQIAGDEKYLTPTWMPPGGCSCSSEAVDPECRRCFPAELRCQSCGEVIPTPTTETRESAGESES